MVTSRTNRQTAKRSENREHDLTFHRFPMKNQELLAKWVVAVRREHFKPTSHHRLCSNHFLKSDFNEGDHRRKLKWNAVPSLFNFPKHIQKQPLPQRRKLERKPLVPKENHIMSKTKKPSLEQILHGLNHDHSYCSDPQKEVANAKQHVKKLQEKCKKVREKLRRRTKSMSKLKDIVKDLKNKNLIELRAQEILEEACEGLSLILFKHLLKQRKVHKNARQYDNTVSRFAITLHYLSPKAYEYIRPTLSLPHPSTLRVWKGSVHCEPGFLSPMLETARKYAMSGDNLCSLIVDEMSLRQEVTWCPNTHSYQGHVDFGGGAISDTVASSALVFMLVSMRKHWKTPIAYFLTNHVDSEALSNSIKEAVLRAADYGLNVKTIVADGLQANMKAAKILGCEIRARNPKPYFVNPHPSFSSERIYFICDAPHMLKLFRNLLAEYGCIYRHSDKGKKCISWKFIQNLHYLQSEDSLYLANKLRSRHVHYKNVKMKVNIAAQTLSASVATALDHLRDDLHHPQFQGSNETCQFIRCIDGLFDILNSKNPIMKGTKAPLSNENRDTWETTLQDSVAYLLSLHDAAGKPLHQTPRGQAVIGFIVTATSTLGLARELLDRGALQYLLTYKFSQDHIETYFSKIRQRNGWNNNPTAQQFRASVRTLMIQNDVKASEYANCLQLDGTEELQLDCFLLKAPAKPQNLPDFSQDDMFAAAVDRLESTFTLPDNEWRYSCLTYTAGFVCARQIPKIKCSDCRAALTCAETPEDIRFSFLRRRDQGGLVCPSDGVVQLLLATEKAFRVVMPSPDVMQTLPHKKFIDVQIQNLVLTYVKEKYFDLFPSLRDHFYDHEMIVEENHITSLIKSVASYYLRMRLFKAGKLHQQRMILGGKAAKRMKLNKLVLFSGQ